MGGGKPEMIIGIFWCVGVWVWVICAAAANGLLQSTGRKTKTKEGASESVVYLLTE